MREIFKRKIFLVLHIKSGEQQVTCAKQYDNSLSDSIFFNIVFDFLRAFFVQKARYCVISNALTVTGAMCWCGDVKNFKNHKEE